MHANIFSEIKSIDKRKIQMNHRIYFMANTDIQTKVNKLIGYYNSVGQPLKEF